MCEGGKFWLEQEAQAQAIQAADLHFTVFPIPSADKNSCDTAFACKVNLDEKDTPRHGTDEQGDSKRDEKLIAEEVHDDVRLKSCSQTKVWDLLRD